MATPRLIIVGENLATWASKINNNFIDLYSGNVQIPNQLSGTGVYSVAGRTGNVTLTINDIIGGASTSYLDQRLSAIYTKIEADAKFALASDLASLRLQVNNLPTTTQIQSNWAQTNVSSLDFIKNKPTNLATTDYVNSLLANLSLDTTTLQTLKDLSDALTSNTTFTTSVLDSLSKRLRVDIATQGLTAEQKANAKSNLGLSVVATTGDYNDLINKPPAPVQTDWAQTDNTQLDFIKNKPTIPTHTGNLINNSGFITSANFSWANLTGKPNLALIATTGKYDDLIGAPRIPADPVQSDWNELDVAQLDYIKNKPTIPTHTGNLINNSGFITSTSLTWANVANKPTLSTVSSTGSYNDLLNKPFIPAAQIQSDWAQTDNTKLDFIKNKPTIPTHTGNLINNSGYITLSSVTWGNISNRPNFSTVAFSGSYLHLTDKPTLASGQLAADWAQTDTLAVDFIKNKPTIPTHTGNLTNNSGYITASSVTWGNIINRPVLADVAFSGNYNDLLNKPTQGFIQLQADWNESSTGSVSFIKNKPAVPTVISALTNDAGYVTANTARQLLSSGYGIAYDNKTGVISSTITSTDELEEGLSNLYFTANRARESVAGGQGIVFSSNTGVIAADLSLLATREFVANSIAALVDGAPAQLDTLKELATALNDDASFSTTMVNVLATKANTSSLSNVAFSGNYGDLSNRPMLFSGSYDDLTNKPLLFSGNYNDLTNKPTIPTHTSNLVNNTNFVTAGDLSYYAFKANATLTGRTTFIGPVLVDNSGNTHTYSGNVALVVDGSADNVDIASFRDSNGNIKLSVTKTGGIRFPDGSVQATATTVVPAPGIPTSSKGSPGDQKGMIAADGEYIYICYKNYDGISNIWAQTVTIGTVW